MAAVAVTVTLSVGGSHTGGPSLPRRIGAPSVFSGHAPIGSAAVAFSSSQWQLDGTIDTIALTGSTDDTYRRLRNAYESTAGISAFLSPDGRRLAVTNGILDLRTNRLMSLPPTGGSYRVPQAWSADGSRLATVTYEDPGFPDALSSAVSGAELDVVDTATGSSTRVADLDLSQQMNGWIAAFAPDGRLAYQTGNEIDVIDPAGTRTARFTIPAGSRIAGGGAWTRDGSGILVASESDCSCAGYGSRWTLTTLDAATGATISSGYQVDGEVGVRMIGWSRAGAPIVVAYDALGPGDLDPGVTPVSFQAPNHLDGLEQLDDVSRARVLELTPDGYRVLATADAESLDVAGNVIADGATRAGDPPLLTQSKLLDTAVASCIGLLLLAVIVLVLRRRERVAGPR
jgi:hypothetical protein